MSTNRVDEAFRRPGPAEVVAGDSNIHRHLSDSLSVQLTSNPLETRP